MLDERGRKARDLTAAWNQIAEELQKDRNEWRERAHRAEKERDEAQTEADRLRRLLDQYGLAYQAVWR